MRESERGSSGIECWDLWAIPKISSCRRDLLEFKGRNLKKLMLRITHKKPLLMNFFLFLNHNLPILCWRRISRDACGFVSTWKTFPTTCNEDAQKQRRTLIQLQILFPFSTKSLKFTKWGGDFMKLLWKVFNKFCKTWGIFHLNLNSFTQ